MSVKNLCLLSRYTGVTVLVLYILWSWVQIENLQAATDLAYDAATCCMPGSSKEQVQSCLESFRYEVHEYDRGGEIVQPRLMPLDFSVRHYAVLIDYGEDGKLKTWRLDTIVNSL
jgi:hypothetical protein